MKSKSFTQTLCTLYLAVLFVAYPLFQHDHYFNMGDNKYYFYLISTAIFLVLLMISILTDPARYYKSNNKKKNKNGKGKNKTVAVTEDKLTFKQRLIQIKDKFIAWFGPKSIVEKFVWAYLVCVIISFIFGVDKYYGFWGAAGWNMGLLIQCVMIACFFVYTKVWEPSYTPFYLSMIGSSIVMFLGIVMRFGIDPLGNYDGLEKEYVLSFISTIGQTSWYSSYICTVLPIGVALFFIAEKRKEIIISMIYTILSFLAIAISDSDSALLGIAGMLMILFFVAFNNNKYMIRFFEITTMLMASYVVMEKMKEVLKDYYTGYTEVSSVKSTDIKLYFYALVASFIILALFILLKKTGTLDKVYEKTKVLNFIRGFIYVLGALGVVAIITYIILNTKGVFGMTEDQLPYGGSIWYFNNEWGHFRGTSWKTCWYVFRDFSLGRKLVGVGPDSLEIAIQNDYYYSELIASTFGGDHVLSCAHNEFFNHFLVVGILGGVSYLGMYVSGIISYIKAFIKRPIVIVGAACIASYMGHNVFCYQTVICTPFIFVIMGNCEAYLRDKNA